MPLHCARSRALPRAGKQALYSLDLRVAHLGDQWSPAVGGPTGPSGPRAARRGPQRTLACALARQSPCPAHLDSRLKPGSIGHKMQIASQTGKVVLQAGEELMPFFFDFGAKHIGNQGVFFFGQVDFKAWDCFFQLSQRTYANNRAGNRFRVPHPGNCQVGGTTVRLTSRSVAITDAFLECYGDR